jgi:aromatic ring hydroxylase
MKDGLRTGAEHREALRTDGRIGWVSGEGRVEDVTAHPATAAMSTNMPAVTIVTSSPSGRTSS